jgi:hypothetical protein
VTSAGDRAFDRGSGRHLCVEPLLAPFSEATRSLLHSRLDRAFSRGSSGGPIFPLAARNCWKYKGLLHFQPRIWAAAKPNFHLGPPDQSLEAAQMVDFSFGGPVSRDLAASRVDLLVATSN